jgi:hypothetical protein
MNVAEINELREKLQNTCNLLIRNIGAIQIGTPQQFPYGWRKAAKGRTVWRIIEEIITQNLEKYHLRFQVDNVEPSDSEVSVYDMKCTYADKSAYINIKSAVDGGKRQKDDISKAAGLKDFYLEDKDRQFFVATFFLKFNPNMTVEISKVIVFPIAWIPDVYVNPSNNGNLQSAYYKDLNDAIRRTNKEFIPLLEDAINIANQKKKAKKQ